jgi:hypothetical protein
MAVLDTVTISCPGSCCDDPCANNGMSNTPAGASRYTWGGSPTGCNSCHPLQTETIEGVTCYWCNYYNCYDWVSVEVGFVWVGGCNWGCV